MAPISQTTQRLENLSTSSASPTASPHGTTVAGTNAPNPAFSSEKPGYKPAGMSPGPYQDCACTADKVSRGRRVVYEAHPGVAQRTCLGSLKRFRVLYVSCHAELNPTTIQATALRALPPPPPCRPPPPTPLPAPRGTPAVARAARVKPAAVRAARVTPAAARAARVTPTRDTPTNPLPAPLLGRTSATRSPMPPER